MPKPPPAKLETFLRQQDADVLATVLLELASEHAAVRARLDRLQAAEQPQKLAAVLGKTLAGWKRSSRMLDWREAREFTQSLEEWLDTVVRELLPKDPPAALALFEAFIEADTNWFGRIDDSDGDVQDLVSTACEHWLDAAALCETPADVWPARLMRLVDGDRYRSGMTLLAGAGVLLDEPALREMVAHYESRLKGAVQAGPKSDRQEIFDAAEAMDLLADALGDPDVKVRSVLAYSPKPTPMQRATFAGAYLRAGRAADALAWLEQPWGDMEASRQHLLAEALAGVGRMEESTAIRQRLFEHSLSVRDFQGWLAQLPSTQHAAAIERARKLALAHDHPVRSVGLLLEIGDAPGAEALLLERAAVLNGNDDISLVPLAQALRERHCGRAETAIYRALLRSILERANSGIYGRGARYWARLREIADSAPDLAPLSPHREFEAEIRARHARKPAFWRRVAELGL